MTTCTDCTGGRYCAPLRCYCGHPICPAVATYQTREQIAASAPTTAAQTRNSWADREHTTWLEKL